MWYQCVLVKILDVEVVVVVVVPTVRRKQFVGIVGEGGIHAAQVPTEIPRIKKQKRIAFVVVVVVVPIQVWRDTLDGREEDGNDDDDDKQPIPTLS